jgi:BirA family biotin operon repressor/biotin-[acetyl-CoA-carboxylase] ligase
MLPTSYSILLTCVPRIETPGDTSRPLPVAESSSIGTLKVHELIQPELLKKRLAQSIFSSHIHYQASIDSTNALARTLAGQGAPEGTLVVTEEQTAGRGRRGRAWVSPAGANLLFSVLLRPPMEGERVFVLTMVLALAGLKAVKKVTGVKALIKWPNDLYVGTKKLAGVLTEFAMREKQVDWAVLGMGMNAGWHPDMPEGGGVPATSLLEETGQRVSRNELLLEILTGFETLYREVVRGNMEPLYEEWNRNCLVLGKAVVIESDRERIEGKALRIDDWGALIIEDAKGVQRRILTGDVSLRVAPPNKILTQL